MFTNGTHIYSRPFDSEPCNWCGIPVLVDENGQPFSRQWKFYPDSFAVYCGYECAIREYDYLYTQNPESVSVSLPLTAEWLDAVVNH